MPEFYFKSEFNVSVEQLFGWHERHGAFERLNPPFMPVNLIAHDGNIRDGANVILKIPIVPPLGLHWTLEHHHYRKNHQFCDRQISGPFRTWDHVHRFTEIGVNRCILEEHINYTWPFGFLFEKFTDPAFRHKLQRLFRFRHHRTASDLELHNKYSGSKVLKFLIAGSSGMLGTELISFLTTGGHRVTRLVRGHNRQNPSWSPDTGGLDPDLLEGYDVIINLAGENIGSGYWTKKKKQKILESRVSSTRLLAQMIGKLTRPPRLFIVASATGYYGNRFDEQLTEKSAPGSGFLSNVVSQWEQASRASAGHRIRTVNMRFGVILSGRHDILARLRPVLLSGLGAIPGSGSQYFPWIALDDAIAAIYHAIYSDRIEGPVNVVAPAQVSSGVFFKQLGKVLERPVFFRIPARLIKTMLDDMGEELFLHGARVLPLKLQETGFKFQFPDLEETFRFYLGRN